MDILLRHHLFGPISVSALPEEVMMGGVSAKCDICRKWFLSKGSMKEHRRQAHPDAPPDTREVPWIDTKPPPNA